MNPSDLKNPPDRVPPQWKTAAGWAKQWKLSASHTLRILKNAINTGLVKQKSFKIRVTSGGLMSIPHYSSAQKDSKPS